MHIMNTTSNIQIYHKESIKICGIHIKFCANTINFYGYAIENVWICNMKSNFKN